MHTQQGFTLFELMSTVAIVAILLAFSNSFAGMLRNNQSVTIMHHLLADLTYARNMAITRNTRITLCKSDSEQQPRQCNSDNGDTGWDQGWIVFKDINNDQKLLEPNNLLRTKEKLRSNFTLTGNRPVQNYISYLGNGFSRKQNGGLQMGSLTLCNPSAPHTPLRRITISSAGRAQISRFQPGTESHLRCDL